MRPNAVFVFPSQAQLTAIAGAAANYDGQVAVILPGQATSPGLSPVHVVSEYGFAAEAENLQGARWTCCGELAVYFVAANREHVGGLAFGDVCLDMLTKLQMHEVLRDGGAKPAPRTLLSEAKRNGPLRFPFVVKPNFGFNSAGVIRISSLEELHRYETRYTAVRPSSLAHKLARRYLHGSASALAEELVVEPDFSAHTLLSIGFHVAGERLGGIFPVTGEQCGRSLDSDFEWEVLAAPAVLADDHQLAVQNVLEAIICCCGLRSGVFHAELFLDLRTGQVHTVEFSPRVPGGAIPELIRASTGVDLQQVALDETLSRTPAVQPTLNRPCRLVRSKSGESGVPSGPHEILLGSYERFGGGAVYLNTIFGLH